MLADQQEALAQLLVDARLRAALGDGGGEFERALRERGLELDVGELDSLRALDPIQLERLAAALAHKRRRAIEAAAPCTARLWPALGERYLEILAVTPARVEHLDTAIGPGLSELARALPGLRAAAHGDPLTPPWTADLIALEHARACSWRDRRARSLLTAYPVHRALAALDEGWHGVELEPERCEYLVEATRLRWRSAEARG